MIQKNKKAMNEVLHYLKGIKEEDIQKIPEKLLKYFEDNKIEGYECTFDYNKSLNELDNELSEEAKGYIGVIALNYWCENEEDKKKLLSKFNENERIHQEIKRQKYNPDNIFNNGNALNESKKIENEPTVIKENIFKLIWKKFMSIFKRNRK